MICDKCPNYCYLANNQIGRCKVIQNQNNDSVLLFNNQISQISIENIEKKPLYHYIPFSKTLSIGFSGCSMICDFCANWKISQNTDLVKTKEFDPEEIINKAISYSCNSITFTYNEPTLYQDYIKSVYIKKPSALKLILKTNAYLQEAQWKDLLKYVDAVNIDFKGSSDDYQNICKINSLSQIYNNIIYSCNNIHTEISIPIYSHSKPEDYNFIFNLNNRNIPIHLLKVYSTPNFLNQTDNNLLLYIKSYFNMYDYVYIHNVYDNSIDNNTYCNKCNILLIDRINKKVNTCQCKI